MLNFFFYILKCAKRDKLFLAILICLIVAFVLSVFIGSTAAYETREMSIVYFSGIARIILVYGFAIFNAFFITKMFQTKEIETFLAGPVKRKDLVIALFLANFLLIFGLAFFCAFLTKLIFFDIVPFSHAIIWALNVVAEVTLIACAASFFALTISNAMLTILITTIFYITARLMGFIVSAIELQFNAKSFMGVVETLIIPISVFFPRLDLFSQSTWLIYADAIPNLLIILCQSLVYIPLIVTACIIDFNKKAL